jgi:hypothetical protein
MVEEIVEMMEFGPTTFPMLLGFSPGDQFFDQLLETSRL